MKKTTLRSMIVTAASLIYFTGPFAKAAMTDNKLKVEGRIDEVVQSFNDDTASSGGARPNTSTIKVNNLIVDFQGKLGEETSIRLRLNFPNSAAVVGYPGPADNVSTLVDQANVQRTLTENLSLVAGKQLIGLGGWYGVTETADIYYFSPVAIEAVGIGIYQTGFALKYAVEDQKFNLLVADASASSKDAATGFANNASQSISGRWYGSFLSGTLKPTVGYFNQGLQNQTASTKNIVYTITNVGLRYMIPIITIDADYIMANYADKTTAGQTDSSNEIDIFGRYQATDNLKIYFGYTNASQKTNTSATVAKTVTTNTYLAGVEYYPKKDENYRYHLVYENIGGKTDLGTAAAATNQVQQQIIAGVRFGMDFLK